MAIYLFIYFVFDKIGYCYDVLFWSNNVIKKTCKKIVKGTILNKKILNFFPHSKNPKNQSRNKYIKKKKKNLY